MRHRDDASKIFIIIRLPSHSKLLDQLFESASVQHIAAYNRVQRVIPIQHAEVDLRKNSPFSTEKRRPVCQNVLSCPMHNACPKASGINFLCALLNKLVSCSTQLACRNNNLCCCCFFFANYLWHKLELWALHQTVVTEKHPGAHSVRPDATHMDGHTQHNTRPHPKTHPHTPAHTHTHTHTHTHHRKQRMHGKTH